MSINKKLKLNIHQAKTYLSLYLKMLKPNEVLTICNRNKPVAELRLISEQESNLQPRKIGLHKDKFSVPDSFFDPLPEDFIAAFKG